MKKYNRAIEELNNSINYITARYDFELQKVIAEMLQIAIEEVQDFFYNTDINVWSSSLEEIERAYIEYCKEYDIPYGQCIDYACVDIMGW